MKGKRKMQKFMNKKSEKVRWCHYSYCNIILFFVFILCINFTSSQQISVVSISTKYRFKTDKSMCLEIKSMEKN